MLGPKKIEFHRCKICGCVTHWSPTDQRDRMGVNGRLMEPEVVARARVRHLDGANTWKYRLKRTQFCQLNCRIAH